MDAQEMLEMGKRCTEEEDPSCTAACPLCLDVRTLLKHVRDGNWNSAWQLFKKQGVFPELLACLCDAPCRAACVRAAADESVNLPLLERAICDYAVNKAPRKFAVPRKNQTVAIVGGGLTGLTAAVVLAGSGYTVELYEKESRPGGCLWDREADAVLPRDILQASLDEAVHTQNITLHCISEIHSLADCTGDAVLLATGSRDDAFRIAAMGTAFDNPDFWQRQAEKGVFCAVADYWDGRSSPAAAIAAGKQAAQRTDWYLKGMKAALTPDLDLGVIAPETPRCGTQLKPELGRMTRELAVRPADGVRYTPLEARTEARRCIDCHCLRCTSACELLKKYRSYPKKYLNDMYQSLNLVEKFSESICKRQIYSCNLCGQCKAVCPEAVDMGGAYREARRILYEKGSLPPVFHEFFLDDMRFSNSDAALTLQGRSGNAYLFFPGCRLGAFLPEAVEAVYKFLDERLQGQVALRLGCCGAPAWWAGRDDLYAEALASFQETWETLGRPEVILACPSCAKQLRESAPDIPVKMLWELFQAIGLPAEALELHSQKFSVFDPCSASGNPALQESVRTLLRNLGAVLVPMKETGGCCGYGGLIAYTDPALLERTVQRRIAQSDAEYVTYCVNCRDNFLRGGKKTRHLLELLFPETAQVPVPSLGEQRENRRRLAHRLQGLPEAGDSRLPVVAEPAVIEKLDRQYILLEQVYRAIQIGEQTGNLLRNEDSDSLIANYQEGAATIWAEYRRHGREYRLLNAYSHHMELVD